MVFLLYVARFSGMDFLNGMARFGNMVFFRLLARLWTMVFFGPLARFPPMVFLVSLDYFKFSKNKKFVGILVPYFRPLVHAPCDDLADRMDPTRRLSR